MMCDVRDRGCALGFVALVEECVVRVVSCLFAGSHDPQWNIYACTRPEKWHIVCIVTRLCLPQQTREHRVNFTRLYRYMSLFASADTPTPDQQAAGSATQRVWKCQDCGEISTDQAVLCNKCAYCGGDGFEIIRKVPDSLLSRVNPFQPSAPFFQRTPSLEVTELFDTSRIMARQALNATNGDFNAACRNLLFNLLSPENPPFLALAESELVEFGGISRSVAKQLLAENGGDLAACKTRLLASMFAEGEAWDIEGKATTAQTVTRNQETRECAVCFDDVPPGGMLVLRACQHCFCFNCIKSHVSANMKSGNTLITCLMTPTCTAEMGQDELRLVIGPQLFSTLERRSLEAVVALDPTLHHCPTPNCTFLCSWSGVEDGLPRCDCPVCHKSSCLACFTSPFHNGYSCEQFKDQKSQDQTVEDRRKDEELLQEYLKKSTIRICKRCGQGVVKSSGCNKMKCRCGYRFCYECGVENALCGHTPKYHGYIDNVTGDGDFSRLTEKTSPT